jgi:rhomboid protease GluP
VNDERCYTCGRRNPSLWGFAPALRTLGRDLGFVTFVVGACAALYVAMLVMSGAGVRMGGLLSLLSPSTDALLLFGASGAIPVFGLGHWWTVASASWLHGGLLHIILNMMGVRQLGPVTAEIYGAARMVIIYTIAGICGFLLSSIAGRYLYWMPLPFLRGASLTIGASASIFGLLGAIVYYGRRGGSSAARSSAMSYVVAMIVFGLIVPGIDNYAHAGGFFGGYLAARWLDPLRPERIDHIVGAVICLAISAVAVLLSIYKGFEALAAAAVR